MRLILPKEDFSGICLPPRVTIFVTAPFFDPAHLPKLLVACKIHREWQQTDYQDDMTREEIQRFVNQFMCGECIAEYCEVTSRWPNAGEDGGAEL